jgi:hypothetical protein
LKQNPRKINAPSKVTSINENQLKTSASSPGFVLIGTPLATWKLQLVWHTQLSVSEA